MSAQNNDRFLGVYDDYADKIYAFVYYKTLHKETAEDLTSATFLKAYEHFSSFDEEKGTISQWLYSIARNTVVDYFRSHRSVSNIEDIWDISSDESVEENVDEKLTFEHLKEHLVLLSAAERELLLLKYWSGYSYEEISDVTGKTQENCRMIVSRGIKKLKALVSLVLLLIFSL